MKFIFSLRKKRPEAERRGSWRGLMIKEGPLTIRSQMRSSASRMGHDRKYWTESDTGSRGKWPVRISRINREGKANTHGPYRGAEWIQS